MDREPWYNIISAVSILDLLGLVAAFKSRRVVSWLILGSTA